MSIAANHSKKPLIVFIHGAFMTPDSWSPMRDYFLQAGYASIAPAWPHHDRSIEELRNHPAKDLGKLGLEDIVAHHANLIKALPEKPILIGHSFGGLVTQILMDRNLGLAGIAIDPAAPKGISAGGYKTARKSVASILFKPWKKTVALTFKQFQYAFVNNMPLEEQKEAFRYSVPETTKIFFQSALAAFHAESQLTVNFKNGNRGPLLIVAGEEDHIVPAAMVRKNFGLYDQTSGASTHFAAFPNRSHWIIAQKGFTEVADYMMAWVQEQVRPSHANESANLEPGEFANGSPPPEQEHRPGEQTFLH
ncbi:alpha/beta hydrolase [Paenibacillus glycinis]|uniref:Alpha/beta fold hydrolase n=1 Tax=Paenibacillus glycinis TaxID=2697035 RepID=A0ABW9XKB5_9BACL|nr:alpha/beta hydrolase [Paenibacillus glycinis]NBD23001.1 alpha/beta fold hydrolase [Paenibacillus glycinis]